MKTRQSGMLINLRDKGLPLSIGRKALNLRRLVDLHFLVPVTYVCTWVAFQRYLADDPTLIGHLQSELKARLDPQKRYAVRSSASLEDGAKNSFAGQFNSSLDVEAGDAVLQAMWHVWATVQSPRVQAYQSRKSPEWNAHNELKMAVMIQEMVHPVVSGVAFSRNPLTGANEVVVEAVFGRGDRLVQEGDTPQRWVNARGNWTTQPEETPTPPEWIVSVVEKTRQIANLVKVPIDLEWVFDGKDVYWVQMREITSLSHVKKYSNSISRDMLPGMIKPLVWSVNIPMIGRTWVKVLTELLGPNDIQGEDLIKAFYYRTYFEMGTFARIFSMFGMPEETLELMMGLREKKKKAKMFRPNFRQLQLLPRAIWFVVDKARISRKVDAFLPRMQAAYQDLYQTDASALTDAELLARIQRLILLTSETAYYNIAAPLLMQVYNGVLRRQVTQAGVDFTSLNLLEDLYAIHRYEPGGYLLHFNDLYRQFLPEEQSVVLEGRINDLAGTPALETFRLEFEDFIERFGHLSDSGNDFSVTPWREQPEQILKMVASLQPARTQQKPSISFHQISFPLWKRGMVKKIYELLRRFCLYREQISSLYTFGYGLLRVYFLALGDHLVQRGILADREDIFYLTFAEVQSQVSEGANGLDAAALSAQRCLEMERCRLFVPPDTIYGEEVPPVEAAGGERLRGIPTARGCYTGQAVVVTRLADFSKMCQGAILVIPYSDVGWTPLFLQAGGVVSESGGMLSHSSIIAREYGIPAVVGISHATMLLDGCLVTVDGYQGEVIVHAREESTLLTQE